MDNFKPKKTISEINHWIESTENIISQKPNFDPIQHNDETRSSIAKYFVVFYLCIIIGILIIGFLAQIYFQIDIDIKEILSIVGTLIGSPLGFVLGYYFKSNN